MTQSELAIMESRFKPVDSQLDHNTHFLIERNGKGMWWVSGEYKFPLAADICEEALKEALEIWRLYGKETKR